mgnify:CR=1 FL=1
MKLLKYIFFSIILLYIQVLFLSRFNFLGTSLYLPLAMVVYMAIHLNYFSSMTITLIMSLIWDIMFPQLLGLNVILNVTICHLVFLFHSNINKEKFLSVFFSVFVLNIIYFLGYWLYYIISFQNPNILIVSSVLSVVFNSLLNVLVLYLLTLTDQLQIVINEDTN